VTGVVDGDAAVTLLHAAAFGGSRVSELPTASKPARPDDSQRLQELLVARSGRTVAGWKVATDAAGVSMYGAIYADDCHASPARVAADRYPLRGVEGEIAYRFVKALPARSARYGRAEIEAALGPFPAIEIVDTRYQSYQTTPMLDRLIDRMSNGGMVIGEATGDARAFEAIHVVLTIDGEKRVDQIGGHARRDPLLPVIEFITAQQATRSFAEGEFITAGTFTGLIFAEPGQHVVVEFVGFGRVELTFA
jgi:2-keto-4-pentenoate hydratase